MKSKNFKKKLVLNKKTIADLNNGQLGLVKGGVIPPSLLTDCFPKCPQPTYVETCLTCLSECFYTGGCATCGPECPTYTFEPICY